ncbi:Nucleoside-diphosphate-sugar epimerase [Saccharopolyspora kobensis]|uniref:Nucleoside-diphosphate-sugar epimerase n=2 Tax=Saccharopolyspora kobensis TaxID=146035 RepID=A0A1H6E2P5_9PSEU|nr:NAD-dependent epimerase/dehydratase family protein [Saccharopolyspora kobensis]SEG91185.1 Nucleoside-diphosphate-sugar epimerase [Saccharopolyspora kobensis]SFF14177.1 Nucleoside-diphosphate-sugar epimerase [Saccharopolyspora kobensis]
MRILVLGGTVFVGHAVAAAALERGHDVVCAARGTSGDVPDGAELVVVDRAEGLGPLAGQRFDAVVDVARNYRWVCEALEAVDAGHWTFVSTINVYANNAATGQSVDAPLLEPITDSADTSTPESYGGIKVACENAVREAMGERAFVVRPGLITGPNDPSDRFGYWPLRMSRGGRVLVPDTPGTPSQHIDVRDLADWIVTAAERGLAGTFDGIGPATTLDALLKEIARVVAPAGTELAAVAPEALDEAGVQRWSGPKSLPLWIPDGYDGFASHDAAPSLAAGLRIRPLAETVAAALESERTRGVDRERKAGLTPVEETELLGTLPHRLW